MNRNVPASAATRRANVPDSVCNCTIHPLEVGRRPDEAPSGSRTPAAERMRLLAALEVLPVGVAPVRPRTDVDRGAVVPRQRLLGPGAIGGSRWTGHRTAGRRGACRRTRPARTRRAAAAAPASRPRGCAAGPPVRARRRRRRRPPRSRPGPAPSRVHGHRVGAPARRGRGRSGRPRPSWPVYAHAAHAGAFERRPRGVEDAPGHGIRALEAHLPVGHGPRCDLGGEDVVTIARRRHDEPPGLRGVEALDLRAPAPPPPPPRRWSPSRRRRVRTDRARRPSASPRRGGNGLSGPVEHADRRRRRRDRRQAHGAVAPAGDEIQRDAPRRRVGAGDGVRPSRCRRCRKRPSASVRAEPDPASLGKAYSRSRVAVTEHARERAPSGPTTRPSIRSFRLEDELQGATLASQRLRRQERRGEGKAGAGGVEQVGEEEGRGDRVARDRQVAPLAGEAERGSSALADHVQRRVRHGRAGRRTQPEPPGRARLAVPSSGAATGASVTSSPCAPVSASTSPSSRGSKCARRNRSRRRPELKKAR